LVADLPRQIPQIVLDIWFLILLLFRQQPEQPLLELQSKKTPRHMRCNIAPDNVIFIYQKVHADVPEACHNVVLDSGSHEGLKHPHNMGRLHIDFLSFREAIESLV
jgi:hypothetical protein